METEVSVPADEVENEAANKRRRVKKEPQATPAGLDFINNLPDDMLIVIIRITPKSIIMHKNIINNSS